MYRTQQQKIFLNLIISTMVLVLVSSHIILYRLFLFKCKKILKDPIQHTFKAIIGYIKSVLFASCYTGSPGELKCHMKNYIIKDVGGTPVSIFFFSGVVLLFENDTHST